MTVYVDSTDGSDNPNYGTGVDGDAFATVQYAVDMIPGQVGGNVIININGEAYAETVTIQGKSLTGNYSITLQGTLTAHATNAQTASVQGATTTFGSISDTTNDPFAGHAGDLLYSSNNAEYRVIDSVTTEVATIVGYWSAAPGGNYTIYTFGTTITSLIIEKSQVAIKAYDIYFSSAGIPLTLYANSQFEPERCKFASTGSFATVNSGGLLEASYCSFSSTAAGYYTILENVPSSYLSLSGCKVTETDTNGQCIVLGYLTYMTIGSQPIVIDGTAGANKATYGVSSTNGSVTFEAKYNKIRYCDTGIYCTFGGEVVNTGNNQYSGNTVNEVATAASYGYID
jgi:hypothetical protein